VVPDAGRRDRPGLHRADRRAAGRERAVPAASRPQGVLGLADKHQAGRLEAACARATAAGDPSYRTVKGILAAGTEAGQPPPQAGDGGAAAFLHGPAALFGGAPAGNVVPIRPPAEVAAS